MLSSRQFPFLHLPRQHFRFDHALRRTTSSPPDPAPVSISPHNTYRGRSSRREHEASQACHCSMEPTLCDNSDLTSADSACACRQQTCHSRVQSVYKVQQVGFASFCSMVQLRIWKPGGTCGEHRCTPSCTSGARAPSSCWGPAALPWLARALRRETRNDTCTKACVWISVHAHGSERWRAQRCYERRVTENVGTS